MVDIPEEILDAWVDWKNDWNLAAEELLDIKLDDEMKAVLSAIQHNKMVSVVSGTSRGKDFLAAVAAFLFMFFTPEFDEKGEMIGNTKVALTAPTGRQITNIMYPEIVRLYNRAKKNFPILPGRLTGSDIRTDNEEWFLTGFKADNHNTEAWSGFHAANTMFVVTEASGIPEPVFDAIEGNLQGNSRLLLVFNFNTTVGFAARSQRSPRFKKFRLNSLYSPNVKAREIVIPGQVDYDWVSDKVSTWCEEIRVDEFNEGEGDFFWENRHYRPNDLFRIKVLGLAPKSSEDVLIPLEWISIANRNWEQSQRKEKEPLRLGVDVAGMGVDNSKFCRRHGNYVDSFQTFYGNGNAEHMKLAGLVVIELKNKKSKAFIDTIGEGAGVYSRLQELGYTNAFSCKFSENATDLHDITEVYEFANMRAYLFWAVRDFLNPANGNNPCLPENELLTEELTEIKYKFQSNGKIIIEPKAEIKKRLKRSPDDSDALANTFYPHDSARSDGWNETQLSDYL